MWKFFGFVKLPISGSWGSLSGHEGTMPVTVVENLQQDECGGSVELGALQLQLRPVRVETALHCLGAAEVAEGAALGGGEDDKEGV